MNNNSSTSLFRVYSPFRPGIVVKVFAAGSQAAIAAALSIKPCLARYPNLRALSA